jgi:hypothetical protein
MTGIPFTADQLTEGVRRALQARDMEAVADFLRVLAAVDPRRAQDVQDTLELGLVIAEGTPS